MLPYSPPIRPEEPEGPVRAASRRTQELRENETGRMSRSNLAIAANVALALACLAAPAARAQDSVEERLSFDRLAPIVPGVYVAGDRIGFSLDASGGEYLLRMDGTPEVFVLYPARASLGGRVLKYDSGETAMLVAGWGGMTLYTDAQPGGLPAVRTGDSIAPSPPSVSLSEMQSAAGDDGQRLGYVRHLNLNFSADWNSLQPIPRCALSRMTRWKMRRAGSIVSSRSDRHAKQSRNA